MQAMTLVLLAVRWDGLDLAYGQEQVLAGVARAGQHTVVSMETPELQMAALIPRDPERVRAMLERILTQLEDGRVRRQLRRLGGAWERGDLAELERYESWCECVETEDDRALLRRLNDDRNPALANLIGALHHAGMRVFAAVGSLHMSGPKALPRLMAERGFRVERVEFQR
jgi:hypothetical protein